MFYGFCSLYSLLIYGVNRFDGYGYSTIVDDFFKTISSFFYWFGGHLFGVEQFYQSIQGHPNFAFDYVDWAYQQGFTGFYSFLPSLLALITTIIVVWGLVRLIVKVCSLGKITY